MPSNNSSHITSDREKKQQRKFKRYAVNLNGVCHMDGGVVIACEIKDVCLSGMYIVLKQPLSNTTKQPEPGETIILDCLLPNADTVQTLKISAQIVRYYDKGVGIVFRNPNPGVLNALNRFIQSVASTPHSPQGPVVKQALTDNNIIQINNQCHALIVNYAEKLLVSVIKSINESAVIAARDAGSNTEQTRYFDTINLINKNNNSLISTVTDHIRNSLLNHKDSNTTTPGYSDSTHELSIMDETNFELWLSTKNIINQTKTEHTNCIKDLAAYLSTLFDERITIENNPYGPELFVLAYNEALNTLDLEHDMILFCNTVFSHVLSDSYPRLCNAVTELLINNSIHSTARIKQPIAPQAAQPEKPDSPIEPDIINKPTQPAQAKYNAEKPPASAAESISAAETTRQGTNGSDLNIYGLVQELQRIKRQINPPKTGIENCSPTGNSVNPDSASNALEYSTDELIQALSSINLKENNHNNSINENINLQALTLSALNNKGAATHKQIGLKDSTVMNVTSSLFESLLKDMLVTESVRKWIHKLEIPILKLALKDESIFVNKDHVARQVLNKVSLLEGYTSDSTPGSQSAVCKKVDKLLNRITENIESDPNIFDQALTEVDSLIKIQNSAYRDNVLDVINTCNNEFNANPDNQTRAPVNQNVNQWQPWHKQASRLKSGDWLYFSHPDNTSERLRLAWIAPPRDEFVFVNLKGIKTCSLGFDQLALRLRDSTIIALDAGDDPALDRAQHSMLDKMHKQLIYDSTHDPLTGLINRMEFERILDSHIKNQDNAATKDTLCYIDIAQFGIINSTYGYEAGDKLLVDITELLLRSLNGKGTLARANGGAYTLLLTKRTATEARNIISQQIDLIRDFRFSWDNKDLSISLNIGMIPITDFEGIASDLIRSAEKCCHTSKESGENTIHVFQRAVGAENLHNNIIQYVLEMEETIANHNVELLCQRIAPTSTAPETKPHHSEIIIRVRDDAGNMLPTQDFILAAEHHHRITTLDRWVIASTINWMEENKEKMADIGGFAINLSGRSLNEPSFLQYVLDIVKHAEIPSEWICFEITETTDINSLSDTSEFITRIKETGCHFSLDDFSSGLSSYTYLKNLPVDYLKIDGSFVKNMHENPEDYAVVKSISDIGHFMGKKVIAEFVENESIMEKLREIGVDFAQGYLIQKPVPLLDQ